MTTTAKPLSCIEVVGQLLVDFCYSVKDVASLVSTSQSMNRLVKGNTSYSWLRIQLTKNARIERDKHARNRDVLHIRSAVATMTIRAVTRLRRQAKRRQYARVSRQLRQPPERDKIQPTFLSAFGWWKTSELMFEACRRRLWIATNWLLLQYRQGHRHGGTVGIAVGYGCNDEPCRGTSIGMEQAGDGVEALRFLYAIFCEYSNELLFCFDICSAGGWWIESAVVMRQWNLLAWIRQQAVNEISQQLELTQPLAQNSKNYIKTVQWGNAFQDFQPHFAKLVYLIDQWHFLRSKTDAVLDREQLLIDICARPKCCMSSLMCNRYVSKNWSVNTSDLSCHQETSQGGCIIDFYKWYD